MAGMLIFGLGYTAGHLAARLRAEGWRMDATGRAGNLDFSDQCQVRAAIAGASHILSSVPPGDSGDPVLTAYGAAITASGAEWIGYLSSTGVYGDTGGAWVDESAPIAGRRGARNAADAAWQALDPRVRIFRLPGIYGPGRSVLDRIGEGKAHRIDLPRQVFSRVHVDDIVGGVMASFTGPPGAYNLADDSPCSQNDVVDYGCALLGVAPPPLIDIDDAGLSPMARAFYTENRRVANGKARRLLGWRPIHSDYRAGLDAVIRHSRSGLPFGSGTGVSQSGTLPSAS